MKKILLLLISSLSINVNAMVEEDLSRNSVSVTSVSEVLANRIKEKENQKVEKYSKILEENCSQEIMIFCSNSDKTTYECLRDNFALITGSCSTILKQEFGKGIIHGSLSIHDLKLSATTKYLGAEKSLNYSIGAYKTDSVFDYRGVRFRKGMLKVRNYPYSSYRGEYVISSALPQSIFVDQAGIEYNPFFQKGPFFFDENGNVKIGTLAKEYEYKLHIYLEKGSVVAFSDDRKLLKGKLSRSVRIGMCGFIKGMDISEKEIEECKKK